MWRHAGISLIFFLQCLKMLLFFSPPHDCHPLGRDAPSYPPLTGKQTFACCALLFPCFPSVWRCRFPPPPPVWRHCCIPSHIYTSRHGINAHRHSLKTQPLSKASLNSSLKQVSHSDVEHVSSTREAKELWVHGRGCLLKEIALSRWSDHLWLFHLSLSWCVPCTGPLWLAVKKLQWDFLFLEKY